LITISIAALFAIFYVTECPQRGSSSGRRTTAICL
jgi:hypothetical protein